MISPPALETAVELFSQSEYEQSNALLEDLDDTSFVRFCRGRNYRYLTNFELAEYWLGYALKAANPFPWAYYELSVLYHENRDDLKAAANALAFLESRGDDVLNEVHNAYLLKMAHRCFDKDKNLAFRIYDVLAADCDVSDYLSELRAAERLFEGGHVALAHQRMVDLQARRGLDPWGALALSRVLSSMGRTDAAVALIAPLFMDAVGDFVVRIAAGHRMLDLHATEEFSSGLATLSPVYPALQRPMIANLTFRYHVTVGNFETAEELVRSNTDWGLDISSDVLASCLQRLVEEANAMGCTPGGILGREISDELAGRDGLSEHAAGAILHFWISQQEYLKAKEIMQRLSGVAVLSSKTIKAQCLQILCGNGDVDEAIAFYEREVAVADLSDWSASLVLRLLAEKHLDDRAVDLLLELIGRGIAVSPDNYFLMQICRRSHRHREVAMQLGIELANGRRSELRDFHRMLVDDLCLSGAMDHIIIENMQWSVSPGNQLLRSPHRSNINGETTRIAAFICVNRAYFYSALTFLMSFGCHNRMAACQLEWAAFLDDDVPADWQEMILQVARVHGFGISLFRERDFLPNPKQYMESYGIFTGGIQLSRAAYFRIYAARYLYDQGVYARANYFDTDIICQNEVMEIFHLPFEGQLILATPEQQSHDVFKAAAQIGIPHAEYFNSGVISFDFAQSDTEKCLLEAIRLSEYESNRLTFHDQCALNLAFSGRAGILPNRFNFFLRPHKISNGDLSEGLLLHYVDRPKPWDVSFTKDYRGIWAQYAAMVRHVIEREQYDQVARSANQNFGEAMPISSIEEAGARTGSEPGPARGRGSSIRGTSKGQSSTRPRPKLRPSLRSGSGTAP